MNTARYDSVAEFYIDGWPDDYSDAVSSSLLSVLGPAAGRKVLDVACGHGRLTREIARRGASQVCGLDISERLIERARLVEADHHLGIRYVHADVAGSTEFADESFDKVSCGFGLSDIDDLQGALTNVARVLVRGGRFAFSILHPCFPGADDISGAWPADARYYDEQRWHADGSASSLRRRVSANHRTLSTYVNTLAARGLTIDTMQEPEPGEEWAARCPAGARFPVYLVVGCTKV